MVSRGGVSDLLTYNDNGSNAFSATVSIGFVVKGLAIPCPREEKATVQSSMAVQKLVCHFVGY
jgi:hypothetical protein